MTLQSLAGKYFITGALIPAGVPGMFGRGRILGPVTDLGMHYLCELYAIDSSELTIRNQIIYSLDALSRGDVYLYDDRELWELESRRVWDGIKEIKKQVAAAQRKQARQRREALKKAGVEIISVGDEGDLAQTLERLGDDEG